MYKGLISAKMEVSDYNILELIPQRPPFIMVDKLIKVDKDCATTEFLIGEDNVFYINGEFQEVGLVENIAQSVAAMEGFNTKVNNGEIKNGFIGAVKGLEIHRDVKPGNKLITTVEISNQVMGVNIYKGTISCESNIIAEAEINVFLQE